jgi:hypothetical protein
VAHPEIPYSSLRYNVQIGTSIDASGNLGCSGTLTFIPCRVLPPAAGSTNSTWEDDPGRKPVVRPIADIFALASQVAEVQTALDALNVAAAKYNQLHNCV